MDATLPNATEKWIIFLKEFFKNNKDISFEKNERGRIVYSINKVFETNLDFSNQYGFLTIIFANESDKEVFLSLSNIDRSAEKINGITHKSTGYYKSDFPCRIYPDADKNKIGFYDEHNKMEENEKYEKRIICFRSLMITIIKTKIKSTLNSLEI